MPSPARGGAYDWPQAVEEAGVTGPAAGQELAGYEAMGGVHFRRTKLELGQRQACVLVLGLPDEGVDVGAVMAWYGDQFQFETWLARTKTHPRRVGSVLRQGVRIGFVCHRIHKRHGAF